MYLFAKYVCCTEKCEKIKKMMRRIKVKKKKSIKEDVHPQDIQNSTIKAMKVELKYYETLFNQLIYENMTININSTIVNTVHNTLKYTTLENLVIDLKEIINNTNDYNKIEMMQKFNEEINNYNTGNTKEIKWLNNLHNLSLRVDKMIYNDRQAIINEVYYLSNCNSTTLGFKEIENNEKETFIKTFTLKNINYNNSGWKSKVYKDYSLGLKEYTETLKNKLIITKNIMGMTIVVSLINNNNGQVIETKALNSIFDELIYSLD